MKTRVIQSEPGPVPPATAAPVAGRARRRERKTAAAPTGKRTAGRLARLLRKHRVPVVAVAVAAAALVPVSAAAEAGEGSGPPAPIDWAACGPRLECGSVLVPLDWVHPDGRTITLSVIRHLASDPGHRIGSLFVNPGGPGDSGVDEVVTRGDGLDATTDGRFDIVGWDLRGTSRSAPASCFVDDTERDAFWQGVAIPLTRHDEQRYLVKTEALAARCGDRNGDFLAHLSTADTVRDLDQLRRLVGDRRLNFLGESVGTMIGQTYANIFPKRVRAMALDGVIDPVAFTRSMEDGLTSGLRDVDEEFDAFVTSCEQAGPSRCALAGNGPVKERVDNLLSGLRHAPIPAPFATPPGELTYAEVLTLIKFAQLPDPSLWPTVAVLLVQAEGGDASVLEDLANGYAAANFKRQVETNTILVCADGPARHTSSAWPRVVDRLEEISRLGGAPMGWDIGAPCASWPTKSANRYTGPWNAATENPILLIGTRLDPNTPLANAQRAERRLGNAVLLTHDGYGHLSHADPSACVITALGRYLVNLSTPAHGTVCPSDHQPFDPDFGQPIQ